MSEAKAMTPDELAKACADSMWADDSASQALGFEIEEVTAGRARLSMTVREDMLNGQRICHGGFIFTLADSAFAFACNSYNQFVVAQHCAISFIAPAYEDDRLIATAKEVTRYGRSGIYDISVAREDGAVIAEFRGQSRSVKGTHLPEDEVALKA
ncbi:hydroxyphenylacetyl-CoA thioesterase PaaI [Denitrobaculum tricleocarpae]|uniref:Hydroxyphenylacetyl-CoA thioesterase PaaI n=1 Tax=Denitrobaculum tricleocarpae TaxID=2591009 RepID=A0A545TER8_9PROT|nr:hydroxyphenylacetyl-CoA thioesterase PaaI [Denitrobaculum tricleocarpae]TQV75719.1 hydroxyphenylacetyl-CoA thioesterase PaaI [Denitrobaculum tricleocarpae]